MTDRKYKQILKQIADKEGISIKKVEEEMQIAILSGYQSKDPEIQKNWKKIHFKGEYPTPKEVIEELMNMQKSCFNII